MKASGGTCPTRGWGNWERRARARARVGDGARAGAGDGDCEYESVEMVLCPGYLDPQFLKLVYSM